MNALKWILRSGLAVVLTGCAGLNVRSLPEGADTKADGIRYYEAANFLLVYSDGAGSVRTEVIVLPDTTRKMVAKPHTFLAKNKQTLTFIDGMMTQSEAEVDSTGVPSAMIAAIKTAASAAMKAGLLNDGDAGRSGSGGDRAKHLSLEEPRLYKIVVRGDCVTLVGADSNNSITLPL
ncbi:hypothetical protein [Prosthecobacter sp.]|uniref:hypothetical protein n=1 Tax=Prosthecobacter sp. TaxID=1965333 RepID=UPI00378357D1